MTGYDGVGVAGARPSYADATWRSRTAPWLVAIALTLFTAGLAVAEGDGGGSSGGSSGGAGAGAGAGGGGGAGGGVNPGHIFSDTPAGLDARAARRAEARGEAKSLSSILHYLNCVASGRVLSVNFEKSIYGYYYAFTVLTKDGRYLDVVLDAKTGQLISAGTR